MQVVMQENLVLNRRNKSTDNDSGRSKKTVNQIISEYNVIV